jgi:DNA-binding NarL/FixJ family response regulator
LAVRVVIADDDPNFLREFVSLLSAEFEVVATAADGISAFDRIRQFQPEIAVMDLRMPGLNGIEVTQKLKQHPSSPAIVICSIENDPEVIAAALQAGALGYILKGRMASDLIPAVKAAAENRQYVSA